jgi:hypothetical protein
VQKTLSQFLYQAEHPSVFVPALYQAEHPVLGLWSRERQKRARARAQERARERERGTYDVQLTNEWSWLEVVT